MAVTDLYALFRLAESERWEALDLSHHELTAIPPEIGRLTELKELHLKGNRLSVLPDEVWQLTSLVELDMSDNEFTWLPPGIGQLRKLRSIDISNNKLRCLPVEIATLPLREIRLEGNGFPLGPRPTVNDILAYVLGLYYEDELASSTCQHINVPKVFRTPLKQYLSYFADFYLLSTDEEINFEVRSWSEGLEVVVRGIDRSDLPKVEECFHRFVHLACQNIEGLTVADLGFPQGDGAPESSARTKLALIEAKSQIRNLQTALEIRDVERDLLSEHCNRMERLALVQADRPINITALAESAPVSGDSITTAYQRGGVHLAKGGAEQHITGRSEEQR